MEDTIKRLLRGEERRPETISMEEYLAWVLEDPKRRVRNAHRYLLEALLYEGEEGGIPKVLAREVYGAEGPLKELMALLKAGAQGMDVRRRILLLVGPPGSAKSTVVYLMKRALEAYSRTPEGALYAIQGCPIHEDPLRAIPDEERPYLKEAYGVQIDQHLCPHCRVRLEKEWGGDLSQIPVERIYLSEARGVGVGVFAAGEPNTQDASELVGDDDLLNMQRYGNAHPYAWTWDGAIFKGNRGLLELVELLKVRPELLHTFLTVAQERQAYVRRLGMVDVDLVLMAHTNYAEYARFLSEKRNEAIRDRTRVIEWPYVLRVREEEKVYRKMLGDLEAHLAPWTLTVAAGVAVLSRLQERKDDFPPLLSLKLHNTRYGENGYPENADDPLTARESTLQDYEVMRVRYPMDGKDGLSPRLVVDWLSAAAVDRPCVTPVDLTRTALATYREGQAPLKKADLEALIKLFWTEYDNYVERTVQKAFTSSFEAEAEHLWRLYLEHAAAALRGKKVKHPVTGEWVEPDTGLLRRLESAAGITEGAARGFRQEVLALVGALREAGESVPWDADPRMKKAIENTLLQERAKVIRTTVSAYTPDEEQEETLRRVKAYLQEKEGYCPHCADWLLSYYAAKVRRSEG
jgi:serine protein kinase